MENDSLLDKTFGYWVERCLGISLGALVGFLVYKYWYNESALLGGKYYDIMVKASTAIFGFLLTILALIVNSSSAAVSEMRKYKSYPTLIKYNGVAVFLAFAIILLSILLFLIIEPKEGIRYFTERYSEIVFKLLVCLHAGICIWSAVDTIIFVRLFYKIILGKSK